MGLSRNEGGFLKKVLPDTLTPQDRADPNKDCVAPTKGWSGLGRQCEGRSLRREYRRGAVLTRRIILLTVDQPPRFQQDKIGVCPLAGTTNPNLPSVPDLVFKKFHLQQPPISRRFPPRLRTTPPATSHRNIHHFSRKHSHDTNPSIAKFSNISQVKAPPIDKFYNIFNTL